MYYNRCYRPENVTRTIRDMHVVFKADDHAIMHFIIGQMPKIMIEALCKNHFPVISVIINLA